MKNETIFSDRLIEAMKAKGLTQRKLGELLEVNQTTISRWLNGKREPDYNTLLTLCAYLEESPNALLGYDEEKLHQWAYKDLQEQVLRDIDFRFLRENIIEAYQKQGKSDEEINVAIKELFERKLKEFCRYFNFTP